MNETHLIPLLQPLPLTYSKKLSTFEFCPCLLHDRNHGTYPTDEEA